MLCPGGSRVVSWLPGRRRCRSGVVAALGLWLVLAGAAAAADERDKVTIEGGPDHSGHNYQFRVTNHHISPIVSLEFPHYRADLFTVPEDWSTEGTTNAMGTGDPNAPGVCRATALSAGRGIAPGDTAGFGIRVRSAGAWRGTATVKVGFADETVAEVSGVPLPQSEPVASRGTRLIGYLVLGVLFLVVVVVRGRRRRSVEGGRASAAPE